MENEQNTLIETQNLILETVKFVLESSVKNQNEIKALNQKLDNLSKISQNVNNIKNQVDKLSNEIREQKNYLKQMIGNIKNENKLGIDKVVKQVSDQTSKFDKALAKMKIDSTEMMKQVNALNVKSDTVNKNMTTAENLIKLIAANQMVSRSSRLMPLTSDNKAGYSDLELCRLAAESGNTDAMYKLAMMYFNGNGGTTKNREVAFEWFQKSAVNGNVNAMKMLADCHKNGWGTAANKQSAEYWVKKSKM